MDDRHRHFAQPLVGRSEHAGFGHRWAGVASRLDLGCGDVLAAADDNVLLAVDDGQIAVLVEVADVAGADVSVGREKRGRRFGRLPVALYVRRSPNRDFADLASRQVAVAFTENRKLDIGLVRSTRGTGLGRVIGPEVVTADGIGLGEAVAE